MEMRDLVQRLGPAWEANPPPAEGELDRIARAVKAPIPDELRAIYEQANGATVGPVDVFTLREYADVNESLAKKMPYAAFFGSDGSDGFFFVDRDDKLHHGRGAVFWVDRGRIAPGESIPSGAALYPFLLSAGAGLVSWDAPRLKDGGVARLKAALARQPARVTVHPPADAADIMEVSGRVGVYLPESLRRFLRETDGLEVGDVKLFGTASLQPADEKLPDGCPVAIWSGERSDGTRYAATVVGWRDSEGGRALVVGPGQTLEQAPLGPPVLDFFAQLVDAWASGRAVP